MSEHFVSVESAKIAPYKYSSFPLLCYFTDVTSSNAAMLDRICKYSRMQTSRGFIEMGVSHASTVNQLLEHDRLINAQNSKKTAQSQNIYTVIKINRFCNKKETEIPFETHRVIEMQMTN